MTVVKIAIVEDDRSIRDNITEFLDSLTDYECVISAPSLERYLEEARTAPVPEVILMDVGLPGMSGIEGTRLIKEEHPETDIVIFTVYEEPKRIFDALCAGASGYLLKSTPFGELRMYLETLRQGGAPMSPRIAFHVIQHFQPKKKPAPDSPLSQREAEVVAALVDGLSYKEVAARLFISIGTVYSHIKNIYKKLHVHSKAELIKKSYQGQI